MKNKLIDSQKLSGNIYKVIVELIPENEIEEITLKNMGEDEANDREKELIDNYFAFNLKIFGNYSYISLIEKNSNLFTIEILLT